MLDLCIVVYIVGYTASFTVGEIAGYTANYTVGDMVGFAVGYN